MEVPLFTPAEGKNSIYRNYLAFYTTTLNGGGQVYNQHRFSARFDINERAVLSMGVIDEVKVEIRHRLRQQFHDMSPVAPIFVTGIIEIQ